VYFGVGKVEELVGLFEEVDVNVVVVDDELMLC